MNKRLVVYFFGVAIAFAGMMLVMRYSLEGPFNKILVLNRMKIHKDNDDCVDLRRRIAASSVEDPVPNLLFYADTLEEPSQLTPLIGKLIEDDIIDRDDLFFVDLSYYDKDKMIECVELLRELTTKTQVPVIVNPKDSRRIEGLPSTWTQEKILSFIKSR